MLLTTPDKDVLPEMLIKAQLLGLSMIEQPAHLRWKVEEQPARRGGASVLGTAKKVVKHLLWGVIENPLLFFMVPAAVTGILRSGSGSR
ncbi:hypothetical protein [Bradyrhizobium sp. sBnM-33]|uniref:hypothetical protein n=1 Tax=Bradyrhizobium sp. sBnM-33 TaxID=2831780 RepID=UPI001BCCD570|nr:hypothetical protein [Bradyrhizobium sp. sBnM-33]WOH48868.1 hypothetical protein RX328_32975 [Bradyrhizobium sp. sBnM-33]